MRNALFSLDWDGSGTSSRSISEVVRHSLEAVAVGSLTSHYSYPKQKTKISITGLLSRENIVASNGLLSQLEVQVQIQSMKSALLYLSIEKGLSSGWNFRGWLGSNYPWGLSVSNVSKLSAQYGRCKTSHHRD